MFEGKKAGNKFTPSHHNPSLLQASSNLAVVDPEKSTCLNQLGCLAQHAL